MDTRGRNTWHTQQNPDITPPSRKAPVTVPPGRGGALEVPQDRHGQDHRTGTSRAEQMTEVRAELGALEAMAVQGAQEAMAGGLLWQWPRPSAKPLQPEPFYPHPTNFPGEVRGYQEPSGARQTEQYRTGQDSPPGPDRQDKTSHRNRKLSWAS